MIDLLFFFFLSSFLIFSLFVILSIHPIFSLIFLILSFLSVSFLLFLLECEFLALIFLIVYVGAIAVLFLFSIMMLDFKRHNLQKNLFKNLPASLIFGLILIIPLLKSIILFFPTPPSHLNSIYLENNLNWIDLSISMTEIEALGKVLYTHCALHLLIIGVILLVVLFGVVYLTSTVKFSNKQNQILFKQLSKSNKLK